ncbi:MAG: polysaccharide biosynthesis C-terminal domain-containing protein, partial [Desulfovibrionaceae bacterium]|nr:polysaccharide biosynthesis C-terminal domain-containing protein [Desulfovibrionaceae bacterium]
MNKENINTDYLSIWKLVWPQALTLIATLAISLIDTWVASKINPQVLASFGILNQSLMFLSIIGQGVVGATLSLVGQAIGAGKKLRAKYISVLMTILACIMGIIVALGAYVVRVPFLLFFKTPIEMLSDVTLWLVIYLATIPLQYIFLTTNAVLRSIKRVKTILVVAILTAILNTVLSIGLTFGYCGLPLMGATGIAVATLITLVIINIVNAVILYKENFIRLLYLPTLRWCKAIQK